MKKERSPPASTLAAASRASEAPPEGVRHDSPQCQAAAPPALSDLVLSTVSFLACCRDWAKRSQKEPSVLEACGPSLDCLGGFSSSFLVRGWGI